jgi:hypothetical protein
MRSQAFQVIQAIIREGLIEGGQPLFASITDGVLIKSRESTANVIPAKAGIQNFQVITKALDPGFRRGDDFFRVQQRWITLRSSRFT